MVTLCAIGGDRLRPGWLDASIQIMRPDPQDADPRLCVPGVEPLDPALPRLARCAVLEDPTLRPRPVVDRYLHCGDTGYGSPGHTGHRL